MYKLRWVLSTLLASAMITSGLPFHTMQRAFSQTNLSRSWEAIFGNLFNQKDDKETKRQTGEGITRGGLCALTPSPIDTQMEIWSDRPLFVMRQGLPPITRVEVGLPGSKEVLDREVTAPAQTVIVMNGGEKPLQIGQTYEWRLFINSPKNFPPYKTAKFRVMNGPERDRIKADLEKIEKEFQGATAEKIAWERAKYFAQKQLWSDVLQEVYSVKNPSPELKEKVQSMTDEVCLKLIIEQNAARSR